MELAYLARTCRRLNVLATPYLYRRPHYSRWWLLADTLITRPDLALQVKGLHDKCRALPFELGDGRFWSIVFGCLKSLLVVPRKTQIEEGIWRFYRHIAHHPDIAALRVSGGIGIMASLCVNLESLDA